MRSNERTGQPMTSRERTRGVWVDLAEWFGRNGTAAEGIDLDRLAPVGLV